MRKVRDSSNKKDVSRRRFLRSGTAALIGAGVGGSLLSLVGCDNSTKADNAEFAAPARARSGGGPLREMRRIAAPGEVEVASGRTYRSWFYDGQFPGPEIRVKEGERLRIAVQNNLPDDGTTVHWHGVPVPNAMDGVPGVTQEPIPPGKSMTYEYEASPAGTYMYHSHHVLQLDRGLVGPLIIEERTPHVAYDREYTLVLDDFLPGRPRTLEELAAQDQGGGEGGMMDGGGMMGGGMMGGIVPPYEGLMINGKLPEDPAVFNVRRGERVRLRLINLSSATTYQVAAAGHPMTVTHTDGRPVEPVEVDSLFMGMGERYDVVVEADNPGVWPVVAATVEGDSPPARAVLRYAGAEGSKLRDGLPDGLRGGRVLEYGDLQSIETIQSSESGPDRTFDLSLSGGMMMSRGEWAIDGQQYPDADPLKIREGEHIRVNMTNMSMMLHPMHLHGHFFRVGNALKDTVLVEPHMGRASFDFVADNPGDWLFHCHNLYHIHAGMARVFTYV